MEAPGPARILVADDDEAIRDLVLGQLARERWQARGAGDIAQIEAALRDWEPDVLVLDLNLPDGDGLSLCRRLRAEGSAVAIIMVTARSSGVDRVLGLEFGADDYLAKPFEPRELAIRVRNLLVRRVQASPTPKWRSARFGPWTLDLVQRRLIADDGGVTLVSAAEFRLLERFLRAPGTVLPKEILLPERSSTVAFDRTLDVQISRLRQKLATRPGGEALILTARAEGYVLASEVAFA